MSHLPHRVRRCSDGEFPPSSAHAGWPWRRGSMLCLGVALLSACSPIRMGPVHRFSDDPRPVEHLHTKDDALAGSVESQSQAFMDEQGAPGLAVALIHAGSICYVGAYGWADVGAARPLTSDTPVLLSSVSKTFIGIAAMQAFEFGRLHLDQPIHELLGRSVEHPDHPDAPILLRHLLTHTSGIEDSPEYGAAYAEGDPTRSLESYLDEYLHEDGELWNPSNFSGHEPGTHFAYSNSGAALAGYVVGQAAGLEFSDLVRRDILTPMQMNDSGYFLADLPRPPATPYAVDTRKDRVHPWPQYGYPTYPDGLMRSSIRDMARYVATLANAGVSPEGLPILHPTSVAAMWTVDPSIGTDEDGQAVVWARRMLGTESWMGHNGSDYGSYTEVWIHPDTGDGFVLLMNARVTFDEAWNNLQQGMADLAHTACRP